MRKLVLILIAFIAVVTFIRAFDNSTGIYSARISSQSLNTDKTPDIPGSVINDLESGY